MDEAVCVFTIEWPDLFLKLRFYLKIKRGELDE